jgi:predicted CoA-binding protein
MNSKAANSQRVVVVGASNKPDRYSYRALRMLRQHGHEVVPINPVLDSIEGVPVVKDLSQVTGPVDTVTMYVGAKISAGLTDKLTALKPKRVIFNPGAENAELSEHLRANGIQPLNDCTLIMLGSGDF